MPRRPFGTYSLVSVILVSLLSLIGLAFHFSGRGEAKATSYFVMVSLAVGGLFGDAFIHLLPESFERFASNCKPRSGSGRYFCLLCSGEISSLAT